MRKKSKKNGVYVKAYTGSNSVLLAMNLDDTRRKGLLGFAIERVQVSTGKRRWLNGLLHFPTADRPPGIPSPTNAAPIQKFRWADYTIEAGEKYEYIVNPVYGSPENLKVEAGPSLTVQPQVAAGNHIVHFNRAAAASQAFSRTFSKVDREMEEARKKGKLREYRLPPEALKWLSDGLLEEIIKYLEQAADSTWAVDIAIYEYELEEITHAVEAAHKRGAQVRIVYHARRNDPQTAINEAALINIPAALKRPRITNNIFHHKFIVLSRIKKEQREPISVLCGSTNFTENGVYRQANVVHVVNRPDTAREYLTLFEQIFGGASQSDTRKFINANDRIDLSSPFFTGFSPRTQPEDLDAFRQYIDSAKRDVLFCTAFNLDDGIEDALIGKPNDQILRFGLENQRSRITGFHADRTANFAAAAMLKNGLEGFLQESTKGQRGNILIHTKVVVVDFTSDNPIIISGSHNFSKAASRNNDENYLVIRGDTDVADAYGCEVLRIYDHYRFRFKVAQPAKARGFRPFALDTDDSWANSYFTPNSLKWIDRERFCEKW
jgi:phosphatidylserine/phosphatidylglycerophosphate/cardiolipin synthase-like enzyme